MKIGLFGLKDQDKKDFFLQSLKEHEAFFIDQDLNQDSFPQETDFEIISVFVKSKLTAKMIDAFPNLKMIAVRSTGFDNIDVEYARNKNIKVANVPSYGSHTVAEFTVGLILAISRQIPKALGRIKQQKEFNYQGLRGVDLFNKTLGVIGTGKIGANVIKIAKSLGMNILAYDLMPNKDLEGSLSFEYTNLEQLLKNSDVVTLHTPATPETKYLINKDNINFMKPTVILINTSRGMVIETSALISFLKENNQAAAGLDVLEDEDLLTEDELALIDLPNVYVTPHMAFYTKQAEEAIIKITSENIINFISGNLTNIV